VDLKNPTSIDGFHRQPFRSSSVTVYIPRGIL